MVTDEDDPTDEGDPVLSVISIAIAIAIAISVITLTGVHIVVTITWTTCRKEEVCQCIVVCLLNDLVKFFLPQHNQINPQEESYASVPSHKTNSSECIFVL